MAMLIKIPKMFRNSTMAFFSKCAKKKNEECLVNLNPKRGLDIFLNYCTNHALMTPGHSCSSVKLIMTMTTKRLIFKTRECEYDFRVQCMHGSQF